MGKTSLAKELVSGWEFKAVRREGDVNSHPPAARECERTWMPARNLPTEVHLDLQAQGKILDPFADLNEISARWVAEYDWIYRTTFETPHVPEGSSVELVFQGLDTFATVLLNGKEILSSENAFVEHRIPVRSFLSLSDAGTSTSAKNVLEIVFDSARRRGLELVDEHQEHRFIVHQTEVSRGPVRKAQYHWGWDWGPILLTCGPWKPVYLEVYETRIEDIRIDYTLTEGLSSAFVSVEAVIFSSEETFTAKLAVDGKDLSSKQVQQSGSENGTHIVRFEFTENDLKLWWPRGYGSPSLSQVTVSCHAGEREVASSSRRIGYRQVELVQEDDEIGESFYFRVNGVDIFSGGSCWIPADSFVSRVSEETYRAWTDLMVEGNQNMIRVWGGGIYEPDAFYDACDESGILVWQDFMFACASYPTWPGYLQSVELEARQNVRRLRHHPSIIAWAGNNEDYQIVERYNLEYNRDDKDPESWLRTNFPARYLYEYLLPKVVDEETCHVVYRPSSPFGNGQSTTLKVDRTIGDVHQWNVWHGNMEMYQKLPEMNGRFVSEFGMEAYPHLDTLHSFITDSSQQYPGSRIMDFHNKAIGHERRLLTYVAENFRIRYDLASFTHLTQVMQADAMAWAYKSWRRWWNKPGARHCGGALVWQLNDCWPTISWAVVDYFLIKKPAFYAIKRAMEPLAVGVARNFREWTTRPADSLWQRETAHVNPIQDSADLTFDVWVANSTLETRTATVIVRFVSIRDGSDVVAPWETSVTLQANGTTDVYQAAKLTGTTRLGTDEAFSVDLSDPFVIYASLRIDGKEVHNDASWPDPIKYLTFADRGVRIKSESRHGKTEFVITAERPVKGFVFRERQGMKVNNNGFDIIPGVPQHVSVTGEATENLKWMYIESGDQAKGDEVETMGWTYVEK